MFRIVVLLSGRGSNFRAIFEDLKERNALAQVVGVVSDKSSAEGLKFAEANQIPCFVVERRIQEQSQKIFLEKITCTVLDLKPDLVVLAGFMRLIPTELIDALPGKIINIHPSLLPAFKGLKAQQQALTAGVSQSGCSVHFVVSEVDSGAVIAQASVPVLPGDTEQSLSSRILLEEHKLYPKVVRLIVESKVRLENGAVVTE